MEKISSSGRFRNSQNRTPVKPSNKKDKLNEKDKQQDTPRELSILEKVVVRPLLLVRKIQLNYSENKSNHYSRVYAKHRITWNE